MSEMEKAVTALDAAKARVAEVARLSTRALLEGGFIFAEIADPTRAKIHDELRAEGVGNGPRHLAPPSIEDAPQPRGV